MNVNKVVLVGRLTKDPEVRTSSTGKQVASLSMATNSYWTDKDNQRKEQTEFHNVVLWGRLAEIAGQYLVKGQECYVEGRLQTRTYTDKNNIERRTTEIVADNLQMGAKSQGGGNAGGGQQQGGGYAPSAPRAAQPTGNAVPQRPAPKQEMPIEEIPTINLDDEKEDIRIEDVPF
ncbi:MAG: single-stranded DNA-binding protein [Candidatus Moraniibacteriota bacterium]